MGPVQWDHNNPNFGMTLIPLLKVILQTFKQSALVCKRGTETITRDVAKATIKTKANQKIVTRTFYEAFFIDDETVINVSETS